MKHPRGSEWRKWDLHVHPPGTKLADSYKRNSGRLDWEQFCKIVHESDVAGFGITDYFSFDGFFNFKEQYSALYPDDQEKVFFPNLELRLPEILNDDGQSVNIHLIFPPDLSMEDAQRFLSHLKTESTTGRSGKVVSCSELKSADDYASATVSRASIDSTLKDVFGSGEPIENFALIITSAKGDGIRPGKNSRKRKNLLVDEIDKQSHGFFAGPGSREHFLNTGRLESEEKIAAKPVFAGSDAHSFDELVLRLGRHSFEEGAQFQATWIKADLTYAGLLQTLAEPAQRVALRASQPDLKEPYRYISRIKFSNSEEFQPAVVFNPNLNSIIGSRSSGKSALLAYIAHAVDPVGTIKVQQEVSGMSERNVGPAAGKTWADVDSIVREVEWGSPEATNGRVIYIPQNSLYSLSEHPDEVTAKIAPALFREYPELEGSYSKAIAGVRESNDTIRSSVVRWFEIGGDIDRLRGEFVDLGNREAVEAARETARHEVEEIRKRSTLSDEEDAQYQDVALLLRGRKDRLLELKSELSVLSPFVVLDDGDVAPVAGKVVATVSVSPSPEQLPSALMQEIRAHCDAATILLEERIKREIVAAVIKMREERTRLEGEIEKARIEHADLIAKHAANVELDEATKSLEKQAAALGQIKKKSAEIVERQKDQDVECEKIVTALNSREEALAALEAVFSDEPRRLDDLTFGVEIGFDDEVASAESAAFDRRRPGAFVARKGDSVDVERAHQKPLDFLSALRSGEQKLNKGHSAINAAQAVLTITPEVRFTAMLETDTIGGFGRSSMTPGKQALFALTLILNESQEPWPLLIDQPEDDLDSRSIFDTIVPYLVERKVERQIILVSHDANLVIGADSEEIIVANRHGVDRPNFDGRAFEYLTGSLEHTQVLNASSPTVLGRWGIREHACEILDGGAEAFEKRKSKYKI